MPSSEPAAVVEKLIAGLNRGDVSVMDEVFHDDAVMDWPQFGERIRGAENRRHVYASIPKLPHGLRILNLGRQVNCQVNVVHLGAFGEH